MATFLLLILMLKVVPNAAMNCCLKYKMMHLIEKMCILEEFPFCSCCHAIGYEFDVEETTAYVK